MIVSPHIGQGIDGTAWRICEQINSKLPIVPITRIENFKFNTDLFFRITDYILVDYVEYGWDWDSAKTGTHFFGKNTKDFPQFNTEEWAKFDEWVANNPPKIYFKRELLKKDIQPNVHPIDYPCWLNELPPIQTKEEFNARPINLFWFWGRSHEDRLRLHSDIWMYGANKGAAICDNLFYLQKFLEEEKNPNRIITVNIPHYHRMPIEAILSVNGISKISAALPGAGVKTFRGTGESPVNSIVLMKKDGMAYSYEWKNNYNCLMFDEFGSELDVMEQGLANPYLYEIYCKGVENCKNYLIKNYTTNYIEKIINAVN